MERFDDAFDVEHRKDDNRYADADVHAAAVDDANEGDDGDIHHHVDGYAATVHKTLL